MQRAGRRDDYWGHLYHRPWRLRLAMARRLPRRAAAVEHAPGTVAVSFQKCVFLIFSAFLRAGRKPVRLGVCVWLIALRQSEIVFRVRKIRRLHHGFRQRRRTQNIASVFTDHFVGRSRAIYRESVAVAVGQDE